jgi:predicted transglutaminase-like cysteine proteinase
MAHRCAVVIRFALAAMSIAVLIPVSIGGVQAFSSTRTGKPLFTGAADKAESPPGWSDFCAQYSGECEGKTRTPRVIVITSQMWRMISDVNEYVNAHIQPMTEAERRGKENVWSFAEDGRGDCKDYVLVKRRKLVEAGLPRESLLVAIVWTAQEQGHAVLIAHTDRGDFVLDNLMPNIMLWSDAAYQFVERQSETDPNAWVYIDGGPAIGGDILLAHGLI